MEPFELAVIVLLTVVILLQAMFLAGLRALHVRITPLIDSAQRALGGDLGGVLAGVKGAKPMDLIAYGALQILPGIAAPLSGAIGRWLSGIGGGGSGPVIATTAEVVTTAPVGPPAPTSLGPLMRK
jgi:hypothetical protein